jgi:hypothetical protein
MCCSITESGYKRTKRSPRGGGVERLQETTRRVTWLLTVDGWLLTVDGWLLTVDGWLLMADG